MNMKSLPARPLAESEYQSLTESDAFRVVRGVSLFGTGEAGEGGVVFGFALLTDEWVRAVRFVEDGEGARWVASERRARPADDSEAVRLAHTLMDDHRRALGL